MNFEQIIIPLVLFFIIAVLYSSVGHAGSSGYFAIMTFMSFSSMIIKPTSLILNILVALIASYKYIKEKCFDWKVFYPFVLTSIPFAFIGGYLNINEKYFKIIAGIFLIIAGFLLVSKGYILNKNNEIKSMPKVVALIIGMIIGFISGIIGVGGGIFLSPIIILYGWTTERKTSGIAALFILLNSITGLLGQIYSLKTIPMQIIEFFVPTVIVGGIIGTMLGTKIISKKAILTILSIVLISAGVKMLSIF